MTRDLRKYARQTNVRLGVGAALLLRWHRLDLLHLWTRRGSRWIALSIGCARADCLDSFIPRCFRLDSKTCQPFLIPN